MFEIECVPPDPDTKEVQWLPHMSDFALATYAAAGFVVVGKPVDNLRDPSQNALTGE